MPDSPIEQQLRKELRSWYENHIFAGKSIAEIAKIPNKDLAKWEDDYVALTALADTYAARRADEARIDELVLMTENTGHGELPAHRELIAVYRYVQDRLAELAELKHKEPNNGNK